MLENLKVALIVGAGAGLSASLTRKLSAAELKVALVARHTDKLSDLTAETAALAFSCDAADPADVARMFDDVQAKLGVPDVVIYNASGRARGPITELDPADVSQTLAVTAFGGFLIGQQAARRMVERGSGVILFTGASASVKGYPGSAPFAMGKFALRGLAQSMARELSPKGVHVAHIVIDGAIRSAANPDPAEKPDGQLDPDAIADTYLSVIAQPRSAWTHETELRPWIERF
ncbi:SDR family NAD(P)-dependent oxidoreductase [Sphingomonas sp. PAMC 26621]|uniref:SDR family NAD(P)-dependent oxidoreductase n=1 Tax=Sphingomonas sp. PAMC 26621 TaxID=1112213 RepID=UPI00028A148B|nr:SDR family NAD(P)-dependent oxidoreductase [Sphingomonas sp. PAMC 26621]